MAENTDIKESAETTEQKELPVIIFKTYVYKGVVLCENEIEEIEVMDTRDDDIWVCSFPRSGTTLTQEIVYLIQTLDFEKASTIYLDERFPVIEVLRDDLPYYKNAICMKNSCVPKISLDEFTIEIWGGIKAIKEMASPRFVKSHLHHFLLPEQLQKGKGRIIYITRNPKDSIHSLYKLMRWYKTFDEVEQPFETFFEMFMDGEGMVNGPWWRHVKEYWAHRNDENMLFLKYEQVTKDLPAAIRTIANFLGKDISENDVTRIAEHCSIENMRRNIMLNLSYHRAYRAVDDESGGFINKGKVGGWTEHLTEEMSKRVDEMFERELGDTGLSYET